METSSSNSRPVRIWRALRLQADIAERERVLARELEWFERCQGITWNALQVGLSATLAAWIWLYHVTNWIMPHPLYYVGAEAFMVAIFSYMIVLGRAAKQRILVATLLGVVCGLLIVIGDRRFPSATEFLVGFSGPVLAATIDGAVSEVTRGLRRLRSSQ